LIVLPCTELNYRHHPEIIDEETMKNITAVNRYDIQLFEIAKQRFQQQIDEMGQDFFDCEVRK